MPARRGVFAGQLCQFGIEILKMQIDTEAVGVFSKNGAHRVQFMGQGRGPQDDR